MNSVTQGQDARTTSNSGIEKRHMFLHVVAFLPVFRVRSKADRIMTEEEHAGKA